jgi:hypothetical protein
MTAGPAAEAGAGVGGDLDAAPHETERRRTPKRTEWRVEK